MSEPAGGPGVGDAAGGDEFLASLSRSLIVPVAGAISPPSGLQSSSGGTTAALLRDLRQRIPGVLEEAEPAPAPFKLPPDDRGQVLAFIKPVRRGAPPPPHRPGQGEAVRTELSGLMGRGGFALPDAAGAVLDGPGRNLEDVRLHTGPAADSAAQARGAEAFTIGREVFFAEGRFDPFSPRGQALVAHELTHVAQAAREATPEDSGRADSEDQEREARTVEALVLARGAGPAAPHLMVDHFVRNYAAAGGGPLTPLERARLDHISIRALARSEELLAVETPGAGFSELAEVRVALSMDLAGLSDEQAAARWAGAIAQAVRSQAGQR
ncbi:MAG: DUF4157 domain-containing protein [Dehalococcoidia bacterium]|nr:DUF4157 domain-containing protein [Dehalococcoidia bacterium]